MQKYYYDRRQTCHLHYFTYSTIDLHLQARDDTLKTNWCASWFTRVLRIEKCIISIHQLILTDGIVSGSSNCQISFYIKFLVI